MASPKIHRGLATWLRVNSTAAPVEGAPVGGARPFLTPVPGDPTPHRHAPAADRYMQAEGAHIK